MSDDGIPLSSDIASTATLKLASLHTLDPFYTPLEERFERITRLARRALHVPVAAITIVKDGRQWFKSVRGWQVTELEVSKSLCSEVIKTGEQIIVNDTLDDLYLMSNPLVCNDPKFRFYAGVAIKDSTGDTIGTFCVMDVKPRETDDQFGTALADLGHMAQSELFASELNNAQSALITKLGESRRQAMFDSLTRLWNRRGGMDLLNAAVHECAKFDHTLGLCLADIDFFKKVNDQFGHPVGDQVLRKVASEIVATVRPQDVVCRYGGEEFMIILRDVDARACFAVANRICANISQMPIRTRQQDVPMTISIGIAMRDKGDDVSMEQLIAKADKALYISKKKGRNCVSFAQD
ncbi:MAG: sensor domain-containing diguanylate cyclase [Gammaproteobacteria bacterium]|nr:sensor domain-containing diguanylate cyclase [Gammaproteobacteria bacterium]MDH3410765.1 sensor domain-containing diguanylate cyclase [Gammaproteobacteria bacterium]MDH3552800.1 sensor domain-containing diguanylate cyclase [Gammaproteobacteria bacterium]